MKPFRERNPIPIAIAGIAVIGLGLLAAFEASNLPFIGGGTTYTADFTDAGGLTAGSEVDVAGIKVGSVTSVALAGDVVKVAMRLTPGTWVGNQTGAHIKLLTLLGQEYVQLTPAGTGPLTSTIPTSRTTTPLSIPDAFMGLASRAGKINTTQLANAFNVLSSDFANTPPYVTSSLQGLSRLSATVYTRDAQLTQLLAAARNVTGVLASRDTQVRGIINDGDVVLRLIESQRQQIHLLFTNSAALGQQLIGLVGDNQAQLAPALSNVHSVLAILQHDQTQLDMSLHELGPFVRLFANTLGTGRWFDTFIANLGAVPPSIQSTSGGSGGLPLPAPLGSAK